MILKKKKIKMLRIRNLTRIELIIRHRRKCIVKYNIGPLNTEETGIIFRELQRIRDDIWGNEIEWKIKTYRNGRLTGHQIEEIIINNRTIW